MAKFSTQKQKLLKRNHGFLKRSKTANGRNVLARRRAKKRSKLTQ